MCLTFSLHAKPLTAQAAEDYVLAVEKQIRQSPDALLRTPGAVLSTLYVNWVIDEDNF